jgi:hypothetical protein
MRRSGYAVGHTPQLQMIDGDVEGKDRGGGEACHHEMYVHLICVAFVVHPRVHALAMHALPTAIAAPDQGSKAAVIHGLIADSADVLICDRAACDGVTRLPAAAQDGLLRSSLGEAGAIIENIIQLSVCTLAMYISRRRDI